MSFAEGLLGIHHTFHEWGYIYTMEGFIMPVTPQNTLSTGQNMLSTGQTPTEVAKEVAPQPAPLLQKAEQDQDPIASQDSTYIDRQVQFRMADNNVLLSPQTLVDTVANASK